MHFFAKTEIGKKRMNLSKDIYNFYRGLESLFSEADRYQLIRGKVRTFEASYALRKVWCVKSLIGITRITDLTELDYIGIPVISATRPDVDSAQITATQGKGLKKIDAIVSALMEAVERFSCANFNKIQQHRFVVNDNAYILPNILNLEKWNNELIDWVPAISLRTNEKKFLPAADVVFPYYPSENAKRPVRPSTTGVSAGNTLAEAVLHGIFEVVERDATSKFLIEGYKGHLLDIETITTPEECNLINLFIKAKIDILIFDLTHLSPLPVFYVSILNEEGLGPNIACAGQGAHILPHIALRRALTEAAQSRIIALQGSREDLIRHSSDWIGSYNYFKSRRAYMKEQAIKNCGIKKIDNISHLNYPTSFCELFIWTLHALYKMGYKDIFYTDLTHAKINIPVAHVIVQGMVDQIVEAERSRTVAV